MNIFPSSVVVHDLRGVFFGIVVVKADYIRSDGVRKSKAAAMYTKVACPGRIDWKRRGNVKNVVWKMLHPPRYPAGHV